MRTGNVRTGEEQARISGQSMMENDGILPYMVQKQSHIYSWLLRNVEVFNI